MIILHVCPISGLRTSGIDVAAIALASAQNLIDGVNTALLVSSGTHISLGDPGFPVFRYNLFRGAADNWHKIPEPYNRPQVVVFHDFYVVQNALIAKHLRKAGLSYVITPHGTLTKRMLQVKWLKKKIGDLLLFNGFLKYASALHCLNGFEREDLVHCNVPIFVVSNGTDMPEVRDLANPGQRDSLQFTFVGRIDPYHKGLDLLLEACAMQRNRLLKEGAKIKIYGPDYRGGKKSIVCRIAKLDLGKIVQVFEPVVGDAKKKVLQETDIFVHTSRFEGQPLAVIEALAYGVPCLLTPETNLSSDVIKAGAGWEVKCDARSISEGMAYVLGARSELQQIGRRARELALKEFDWQQVATKHIQAYRDLGFI